MPHQPDVAPKARRTEEVHQRQGKTLIERPWPRDKVLELGRFRLLNWDNWG
jgi:hypothetical protein